MYVCLKGNCEDLCFGKLVLPEMQLHIICIECLRNLQNRYVLLPLPHYIIAIEPPRSYAEK